MDAAGLAALRPSRPALPKGRSWSRSMVWLGDPSRPIWHGTIGGAVGPGLFRASSPPTWRGVVARERPLRKDAYANRPLCPPTWVGGAGATLGVTRAALTWASSPSGAPIGRQRERRQAAPRHASVLSACGGPGSSQAPEAEAGTESMLARVEEVFREGVGRWNRREAILFTPALGARPIPRRSAAFIERRAAKDQDALFRAFRSARGIDLGASVAGTGSAEYRSSRRREQLALSPWKPWRAIADGIPGAKVLRSLPRECGPTMAPVERPDLFRTRFPRRISLVHHFGAPA